MIPDLSAINGVLAYLDAVTTADQQTVAAREDQGIGAESRGVHAVRTGVAKAITSAFRLMSWDSPLTAELDDFRLYHREDSADALAAAWCLKRRGADPVDALTADYRLRGWGILYWEDVEEMRAEPDPDSFRASCWRRLRPFHKNGDRIASYSLPTSSGYLLIREDRLVWDAEAVHMCLGGAGGGSAAAHKDFNARGGTEAFLAGKFE